MDVAVVQPWPGLHGSVLGSSKARANWKALLLPLYLLDQLLQLAGKLSCFFLSTLLGVPVTQTPSQAQLEGRDRPPILAFSGP